MVENNKKYFCIHCDNFKEEGKVDVFQFALGIQTHWGGSIGDNIRDIGGDISFTCLTCRKDNTNYYCGLKYCLKCPNLNDGQSSRELETKERLLRACEFNNESNKKDFSSPKEHDCLMSCEGCGEQKPSREK
jgi:hypothetical protein